MATPDDANTDRPSDAHDAVEMAKAEALGDESLRAKEYGAPKVDAGQVEDPRQLGSIHHGSSTIEDSGGSGYESGAAIIDTAEQPPVGAETTTQNTFPELTTSPRDGGEHGDTGGRTASEDAPLGQPDAVARTTGVGEAGRVGPTDVAIEASAAGDGAFGATAQTVGGEARGNDAAQPQPADILGESTAASIAAEESGGDAQGGQTDPSDDGGSSDADDDGNPASDNAFSISVLSDTDGAANQATEGAADGTAVGITALATDADATDTVRYSLDDDAGGRFAIDATTGVVTVADGSLLDREAAASHDITVRATSTDGSFSTETLSIAVGDANEAGISVLSDTDGTANQVTEGAADGTAVGVTALATDADATDTVRYSLDDDAGGRFAIDATTGVVTVADGSLLDREAAASHDITVRATSTDGSFSTETVTIDVGDANEASISVLSDTDGTANQVTEGAADGTAVGVTALATDADATDAVSYSLDDDAGGRFAIDAETGVITVADGSLLDSSAAASHDIIVRATSTDGSFSTKTVSIAVDDGSGGRGRSGDDNFVGDSDDDTLVGGARNDVLDGGTGDDTLNGSAGNDVLIGGTGDDALNGGSGDDSLIGGAGNDVMNGGAGNDIFLFDDGSFPAPGGWTDAVDGGSGTDTLNLADTSQGWVIAVDQGPTIDSTTAEGNEFVDAGGVSGTITFDDGSTVMFENVERFEW